MKREYTAVINLNSIEKVKTFSKEVNSLTGRRVSVSGMLKVLGVSRSGYTSFLNRKVSPTRQRKDAVKKEIQKIYDNSKQNYGAPKIT